MVYTGQSILWNSTSLYCERSSSNIWHVIWKIQTPSPYCGKSPSNIWYMSYNKFKQDNVQRARSLSNASRLTQPTVQYELLRSLANVHDTDYSEVTKLIRKHLFKKKRLQGLLSNCISTMLSCSIMITPNDFWTNLFFRTLTKSCVPNVVKTVPKLTAILSTDGQNVILRYVKFYALHWTDDKQLLLHMDTITPVTVTTASGVARNLRRGA